jgi:hypothetical protein
MHGNNVVRHRIAPSVYRRKRAECGRGKFHAAGWPGDAPQTGEILAMAKRPDPSRYGSSMNLPGAIAG